jgi:outer membrane lipoprotein-sorting protein
MYPGKNNVSSSYLCVLANILFVILVLNSPSLLYAITGLEVIVNEDERDRGKDVTSTSVFRLINKRGQQRIRNTVYYWKDWYGRDGFDEKTIIFFNSPPEVEGTGFLNWSYMDINKDDDQWLYLPALRKIKRISGSDKEDSFMGTDFTFDDMGDRQVEEDVHKLVREEKYQNSQCYVVESIPKEKKYIYSKKMVWVDKQEWIIHKVEFYDRKARHMKTLLIEWIKVQGIWARKLMHMSNVQTGHQTFIEIDNIKINTGLGEDYFTKRTLRQKGH